MAYFGTQPNEVKKNTGLYTPSEILQLTKDGSWGGSLELIQEQTVSSVTTVDFLTINENKYDVHLLTYDNITKSSDSNIAVRFYENGVLETASVYEAAYQEGQTGGTFQEIKSTSYSSLKLEVANQQHMGVGYSYFYNLGNSSKYSFQTMQTICDDNPVFKMFFGGGVLPQASLVNGLRVLASTSFSGTIKLYGVKQI
jgi:hypothetical protein